MIVGIIGAMQEEVEILQAEMTEVEVTLKASMMFFKGKLSGKDIVVVRSGVGKVNAAVCAEILVDLYRTDVIINTGIAGSLDPNIDIGDIVISKDAVHHDMDATIFGDAKGQVPRMDILAFPADMHLAELARLANEKTNPEIKAFIGRVATGDQFVSSKAEKERIVREFGALCTEMEGAGVAQTAYLNKTPYVIVRAISDKADDSAVADYPEFEKHAIERSVKLVKAMLEMM